MSCSHTHTHSLYKCGWGWKLLNHLSRILQPNNSSTRFLAFNLEKCSVSNVSVANMSISPFAALSLHCVLKCKMHLMITKKNTLYALSNQHVISSRHFDLSYSTDEIIQVKIHRTQCDCICEKVSTWGEKTRHTLHITAGRNVVVACKCHDDRRIIVEICTCAWKYMTMIHQSR